MSGVTDDDAPPRRGRRPNPERKAATREQLLGAALDSLAELGYASTTTTEVVGRAGLSRGALFSHCPSRHDLMAAVVERAMEELGETYDAAFAAARSSASDEPAAVIAIQAIHEITQSSAMNVVMRLYGEAATSPPLREVLQPVAEKSFESLLRRARVVLPRLDEERTLQEFLVMWFSLLGMASYKPVHLDSRAERAVLDSLIAYARRASRDEPGSDHPTRY